MKASTPTLEHAEALNQDGADISYFVEVGMGSNKKPVYMLIDTGAGTSWVMGSDCKSPPCKIRRTFGPPDSTSLVVESASFGIHYGSGVISGIFARDTIHIAGLELPLQFGLANETSSDFERFPFDGILGLGMRKGATENFMQELIAEELLDKNLFGVYLNRASDGDDGGEISFGAINPEKYIGEITYTKVHDQDTGDWSISMQDFSYGDGMAGVTSKLAYIDTGTSYAFGPKDEVAKIYALIDGASSSDGVTYNVPCDADKELAVTFSGRKFFISSRDWLRSANNMGACTGNIYGIEAVRGAWLLGDVFLKNVYAVFDAENKQIGFATRPEISPPTVSSQATQTLNPVMEGSGSAATSAVANPSIPLDGPTPAAGDRVALNIFRTIMSIFAVIAAVL